jgi:hypothetical protein
MNGGSMKRSLLALVSLAAITALVWPMDASAQRRRGKKKKKAVAACEMSYLGLVEGTSWTYELFAPPDAPERRGLFLDDPPRVTVKVTKVEASGKKGATVTLEETHRKFSRTTTITCHEDDGVRLDPHSFLFAAEVGGGLQVELAGLKREGHSFPGKKDFKTGTELIEELKANATRVASPDTNVEHAAAKLEIEREMKMMGTEPIESALDVHNKAMRVDISVTGRAGVAPELDKLVNMPAATSVMWFAPGVGLVRAQNRLGQGWQLIEMSTPE